MTGTSRLISCLVAAELGLPVPVWVLLQPNVCHATAPESRVSVLGHGQLYSQSPVLFPVLLDLGPDGESPAGFCSSNVLRWTWCQQEQGLDDGPTV